MIKLAYCGIPYTSGVYTVYRLLRQGLITHNIDLRWVGLAQPNTKLEQDFASEINSGEFVYFQEDDCQTTKKFVEHIEANYDGIIFNVLAGVIQTNAARFLSNQILKLQIVHNITPATYRAAHSIRDHVHATVCVSPRIENDLVKSMGFMHQQTITIPNAVDVSKFQEYFAQRTDDEPIKLLSLGRVEDAAKGILWLPDILQTCLKKGLQATLTVAGDGPDLPKLKQKIHKLRLESHTQFIGKVNYIDVPQIFASHHALLMPSRYEGFGYTITESMASGCIPVCSEIKGVTDFIVSNGKDGYLFPVGNIQKAAESIAKLEDRQHWQELSDRAKGVSNSRFNLNQQSEDYAKLIYQLKAELPTLSPTLSMDDWAIPSGLKSSLSVYLPNNVKNILRLIKERLRK